MRICQVEIDGFRGIKTGRVVLPKHSVLLGANNTGKSAVAEALALLAGRERMTRPLCDWDFYGGAPKPDSRFSIVATITDFGNGTGTDPTEFPEWFGGENSARPVWWLQKDSLVNTDTDPPDQASLAAQIAMAGRYDDEACEFETIRYFYDGVCDPFIDDCRRLTTKLLRELGLFLLPSNREWEHLLGFGSSSFLKLLREYSAVPGKSIENLKNELRSPTAKIEEQEPFKSILESAERELHSFMLVKDTGRLVYRPTSLDALAVLRSLVAHVDRGAEGILPLARHGSGTVSLQAFLLLIAFGDLRKKNGQNFIFIAEEPELHLHPSLHSRLVQRIRGASTQSLITTQSPNVAASYQPSEVIFSRNVNGVLSASQIRREPIASISSNSIRNLYLRFRQEVYQALMGGTVVVPEGETDHRWLHLWQRVAEASVEVVSRFDLRPINLIPTSDGAVVSTYSEIRHFRPDAAVMVDGDDPGLRYVNELAVLTTPPARVLRLGDNAGMECLCAWLLEPSLTSPGPVLAALLPDPGKRNLKELFRALKENKDNKELHEKLAWEAVDNHDSALRAGEFIYDVAALASGSPPANEGWVREKRADELNVFIATHIQKP